MKQIVMGFLAFWLFPLSAYAQCMQANVYEALSAGKTAAQTGDAAIADTMIASLVRIQNLCAGDANVELALAYAFEQRISKAGTTPDQQVEFASNAWLIFDRLDQIRELKRYPQDSKTEIQSRIALGRHIVRMANTYKKVPSAFLQDNVIKRCPFAGGNMIQNLYYDYKKQSGGHALYISKKIADACISEDSRMDRDPLNWYAQMLVVAAKATEDEKQRTDFITQAREAYFQYVGQDKNLSLDQFSASVVLKSIAELDSDNGVDAVKVLSEMDDTPFDRIYVKALVGYSADAVWSAEHSRVGSTDESKAAFKAPFIAYRALVTAMDAAARVRGPHARKALFEGLNAHADKTYRREKNKDALTPLDLVRKQTDPSKD